MAAELPWEERTHFAPARRDTARPAAEQVSQSAVPVAAVAAEQELVSESRTAGPVAQVDRAAELRVLEQPALLAAEVRRLRLSAALKAPIPATSSG